jgi:hypothetical protein
MSKACGSSAFRFSPVEAEERLDLSSDIPDTSRDKTSLEGMVKTVVEKMLSMN